MEFPILLSHSVPLHHVEVKLTVNVGIDGVSWSYVSDVDIL